MTGKQLKKMFESDGWKLDRIKGSHHIMVKDNRTAVIPIHANKDIPKGTLNALLKVGGFK